MSLPDLHFAVVALSIGLFILAAVVLALRCAPATDTRPQAMATGAPQSRIDVQRWSDQVYVWPASPWFW